MCSAACEESALHKNGECRMIDPTLMTNHFNQGAINSQVYQCITPLLYLTLPDSLTGSV
jgi:hypothetical protein